MVRILAAHAVRGVVKSGMGGVTLYQFPLDEIAMTIRRLEPAGRAEFTIRLREATTDSAAVEEATLAKQRPHGRGRLLTSLAPDMNVGRPGPKRGTGKRGGGLG